jgi:hypothetical protein
VICFPLSTRFPADVQRLLAQPIEHDPALLQHAED